MQTLRTEPLSRAEVLALIGGDLKKVEKSIGIDTVCSVEAVTAISHHLQLSGGKRLRPMLLLLASGACGYRGESAISMGAVMEIIHTATLVHDDVIDEAEVRRGKPSINLSWGNGTSVLAGDWLYMQAFRIALRERSFRLLDLLIDLTQTMVEGELMQTEMVGRIDVAEQEHLDLVHRKTASLFSVCARMGAVLGGADREVEDRLGDYGWNLGMAFQLIDDVLDISATEAVLGKPVGNDLREGKVTLPLILALAQCESAERAMIETVISDGGYENVSHLRVREMLDRHGAIETVRRRAVAYTETASEKIAALEETPYKRALASIPEWVVDRKS